MAARPEIPSDGSELRVAYQYMDRPLETGDASKLLNVLGGELKRLCWRRTCGCEGPKSMAIFPTF